MPLPSDNLTLPAAYQIVAQFGPHETGWLCHGLAADGTPHLLKLVPPELAALPGLQAALEQQGLFLATLAHPGLLRLHQVEAWADPPYLVLEWCSAGSLRDLLRQRGSLADDLPLALDLAAQLAAALAYLHAQGFVHGGLAPAHLLLAPREDGGFTLKLSNLGLAWLLLDYDLDLPPWADTLLYAFPPERCHGLELDAQADVYAFGVILYELVTGCVPFAARNLDDAVIGHVYTQPVPPSALNPAISTALDTLILRCIAKERNARYATGGELVAALKGATPEDSNTTPSISTSPPLSH
ncbi:MAG: serine/threonine protein kinase, partial [Candidatus Viridilinea halotolerans]